MVSNNQSPVLANHFLRDADDRKEYRGDTGPRAVTCKPADTMINAGPLESLSVQRRDYVKWKDVFPHRYHPEKYRPPDGDMDLTTTSRVHFSKKPLPTKKGIRVYVRKVWKHVGV